MSNAQPNKKIALIGNSGFVGSNLEQQVSFTHTYNSQTIAEASGQHFDLLVIAAPSAVKWRANKFPDEDRAMVQNLMKQLDLVEADECVSISTCDVYEHPQGLDEDADIEPTLSTLHAYGKHRYELEKFIREKFKRQLIVRLPALFGQGLKKNVIYDFLHNNQLEAIHSESMFQFYNLEYLWRDITTAREAGITLLNITSEPVSVSKIALTCFNRVFKNQPHTNPAQYDVRSKHAELFGGENGYLYDAEAILDDISAFVQENQ